jgi:hypothetical protein
LPAVANYASLVGLISGDCRVTEILDHGFFCKKKKLYFQSFFTKKKNLENTLTNLFMPLNNPKTKIDWKQKRPFKAQIYYFRQGYG